jgi:hypothetical protein
MTLAEIRRRAAAGEVVFCDRIGPEEHWYFANEYVRDYPDDFKGLCCQVDAIAEGVWIFDSLLRDKNDEGDRGEN